MNNRIRYVRKRANLNQYDFGKKIGITKSSVSLLESGKNSPSEQTIRLICLEFDINEEWLRTGKGEMYSILEDETYKLIRETPFYSSISKIMNDILRVMKNYEELDIMVS